MHPPAQNTEADRSGEPQYGDTRSRRQVPVGSSLSSDSECDSLAFAFNSGQIFRFLSEIQSGVRFRPYGVGVRPHLPAVRPSGLLMSGSHGGNPPNGHRVRDMADLWTEVLAADKRARRNGTQLLTPAGLRCFSGLALAVKAGVATTAGPFPVANGRPKRRRRPRWDARLRQLWLGKLLLKEFRQPAPYQTALLDAFQRRGWSCRFVKNPLAATPDEGTEDVRRRLHDTIKNLNRGLPVGTIRFRGNGGSGVWWEHSPGE